MVGFNIPFLRRFTQKQELLVELGNFMSKVSLWQKTSNSTEMIKQFEVENPFFKNGIIKNKKDFIETIEQLMENLKNENWSNVTVGIESSQIIYSSFEIKSGTATELSLLEHLNKFHPNHKLIHLCVDENRVSCLSIPQSLLDKIYSSLNQLGLKINKFIPINYYRSSSVLKYRKEKLSMVLNLGYRSVNVSVFHNDFLLNYKTLNFGVEQIILALATKYAISIQDAKLALVQVPLIDADERDWVAYSGKYFRMDKISEMITFYVSQLARKILDKDFCYVEDLILTGWSTEIKNIEQVFKRFASIVTLVPKDDNEKSQKIFPLSKKSQHFLF